MSDILTETGICYNSGNEMKALFIGQSSNFEIELEQTNFIGINKICKQIDLPVIKITFSELSENLINFLKNTIKQDIQFWNKTGLHDGIYQPHYYQDEFKQQVILTLYQKISTNHTISWTGNQLELGEIKQFYFGKDNFKIGNYEFDSKRAFIEKNINTEIERFKFADGYKYFFKDTINFKITFHEPTIDEILQLNQLKNSMVNFTSHTDQPDNIYSNFFAECKFLEVGNEIKIAEISLSKPC